ncbi:MAG TPA: M56 family metallopeptidase [Phycisphaerae bacterium]|nr:M56 family metallopeptidase [Phycisphaerae bacterium]HRW52556.1 M56 family metallopeptidase [Phycisphaerae bacterium]
MTRLLDLSSLTSLEVYLLNLAWLVTLFGALAIVGERLAPRRAIGARCHLLTWGLILIVMAPIGAEASRRWFGGASTRLADSPPLKRQATDTAAQLLMASDGPAPNGEDPIGTLSNADATPARDAVTTRRPWGVWIAIVWLMGVAIQAVRTWMRIARAHRLRSTYDEEANGRMRGAVVDASRRLGLVEIPEVRVTSANVAPHTLGFLRPLVVFPTSVNAMSDAALRAIAIHEVAHLKSRHHWLIPIQAFARCVFYWHPLVLMTLRRLDAVMECACDAHVVEIQDEGRTLAHAIVAIAERIVGVETPGLAMVQHPSDLERRVAALVAPKGDPMRIETSGRSVAALSALSILAGCGALAGAARSPVEEAPPRQSQSGRIVVRSSAPGPRGVEEIPVQPPRVIEYDNGIPPTIIYPPSRASSKFLDGIAVDEGVSWQGAKAYIGLLPYVVVEDDEAKTLRWKKATSAFYDTLTFRNVAEKDSAPRWTVRLRNSQISDPQTDAYFDLRTGEEVRLPEQENRPEGTMATPLRVWTGATAVNDQGLHTLVADQATWKQVRETLFGDLADVAAPGLDEIDFDRNYLVVLSSGRSRNCNGISCASAYFQKDGVLLRTRLHTYQTGAIYTGVGKAPTPEGIEVELEEPPIVERPYGLFLFPRSAGDRVVVEGNAQRYLGGPPLWKRRHVFDVPK